MSLCRSLFLIPILICAAPGLAQVPAVDVPGWRMPQPSTAHPAPFRPASDGMVRDALRSELFTEASRSWHLEARMRLARRPGPLCRQCDAPVRRRNTDLCPGCASQWRASGARGWDFPIRH